MLKRTNFPIESLVFFSKMKNDIVGVKILISA